MLIDNATRLLLLWRKVLRRKWTQRQRHLEADMRGELGRLKHDVHEQTYTLNQNFMADRLRDSILT